MDKIVSRSPGRFTFQREGYKKRCMEKNEEPNEDYLDLFDKMLTDNENKWNDPAARENNMEWDLVTTDWILEKVRGDEVYAQHLYAALCNNDFIKQEMWPLLKNQTWGCSWRHAGGIISDMRQEGDYIDWYCSGIGGGNFEYAPMPEDEWSTLSIEQQEKIKRRQSYASEGTITDEIKNDFLKLGWLIIEGEE